MFAYGVQVTEETFWEQSRDKKQYIVHDIKFITTQHERNE